MTIQLTPGRWRGLQTTSLKNSAVFSILAFDQRGSYRRMLPDNTPYADAVTMKVEIVSALSQYASAVLLDAIYGLSPAMQMTGKSGLLMSLEKSGYSGDSTYRRIEFVETWTPEKIQRMGANAVKIMVYYNPKTGELADELDEVVKNKVSECHALDLPVFLEPMSYSSDESYGKDSAEFAAEKAEIVIKTARRLSKTGADVLKMEFPLDYKYESSETVWRQQCEALSAACDVPWVLLSAGVDFETFEKQTIVACESGASGFLAGRAIWKEAVDMTTEERDTFLKGQASDRIKRLIEIAESKSRPWTDFYSAPESTENWFDTY